MKSLDYRTWGLVEAEVGRRLAQHCTHFGDHALGATLGIPIARCRQIRRVRLHRAILQHDAKALDLGYLSPVEFERKIGLA